MKKNYQEPPTTRNDELANGERFLEDVFGAERCPHEYDAESVADEIVVDDAFIKSLKSDE